MAVALRSFYERRRLIEKGGKIEDWRILLSDPMTLIKDG
jgi:hypothetical protein